MRLSVELEKKGLLYYLLSKALKKYLLSLLNLICNAYKANIDNLFQCINREKNRIKYGNGDFQWLLVLYGEFFL